MRELIDYLYVRNSYLSRVHKIDIAFGDEVLKNVK